MKAELSKKPSLRRKRAGTVHIIHIIDKVTANQRDAMKGRSPFILIPQNRLCRFEERLKSRFLCHFLPAMRNMTRK